MIFYDFEVFRLFWLCVLMDAESKTTTVIKNNPEELTSYYEQNKDRIFIGYNSNKYDVYIFKAILLEFDPYEVSQHIINGNYGYTYSSLFNKMKLLSYDVMTMRDRSLKQLEGFLGNSIKESDVPFDIDRELTEDEIAETVKYCTHDVINTIEIFSRQCEEFNSQIALLKAFKLPLSYINKTKAQLAAIILNAHRTEHNDEFNITIPDTLRINKYTRVLNWYSDTNNRDYDKYFEIDIAGVSHVFAWGGLHGAINNYHGTGIFVNIDVASFYPSLMLEYGFSSRNIADTEKYKQIYEERLRLKKEKNPMQQPYKIVLNSTYGAMKDKYNNLYDPLQANNVCVGGQLLLLDLIEKLEGAGQLIQSNTDGLIIKIDSINELKNIKFICSEWENRTRMKLEFETFDRIYQKDVNNYSIIHEDGTYKSKGAYVKKLDVLDYDLPIVNKALVEYFLRGTPVETTIKTCNNLKEFQKIVKITSKYKYLRHGNEKLNVKVIRVFASRTRTDQGVYKVKQNDRVEKIANTPERCFIVNDDVNSAEVPRKLNKKWYIDLARKRLNDFLGIDA